MFLLFEYLSSHSAKNSVVTATRQWPRILHTTDVMNRTVSSIKREYLKSLL